MRTEWRTVKLIEVAAKKRWALNGGPFGSKLSRRHYSASGVPVIRGTNLPADSKFSFDDFVFVTNEKADELQANNAHPGDLVFTQRGTIGQVGLIPTGSPFRRFVISQSQMKLTVDPSSAHALFLYYFFSAGDTVQKIKNLAFAAGVPHINLDILRNFEVPLPPLPVQRRIAGVLSAYDELIENGQRRIRILEEMARALYREWFVHFRFPGHENHVRVPSSFGEIPTGWEVSSFRQAATFENGDRGKNYPNGSDFVENGTPFINAGHLVDGAVDFAQVNCVTEAKFEQLRSGKIREGDILYCLRGSPGRTARTAGTIFGAIASSLVIIRPTGRANREFLYYTLSGESGSRMVSELNNGAAQPNVSVGSVQKYPLLLPSTDLLNKFAHVIAPKWRLIDALRAQLAALKAQRDLLLPRLLSGQLELDVA